jgi:hypothetical protein
VESLRGLGYSTSTALADLIDNSISAQANFVEILMDWNEGAPTIAVLDDGAGMDEQELNRAFCFGGIGPSLGREAHDLGRFGLGLKTASLSQCRRMSVVSRRDEQTCALMLDIDVVEREGWVAIVPDSLPDHPAVRRLSERTSGTLVLWDRIDERSGLVGLDRESFFMRLQDVRTHMGMVFHRFLSGDARKIDINVNGRGINSWDPFLRSYPSTTPLRTERIRGGGSVVTITPWVLPHRDRFANEADYVAAGGPGGWAARQGFYVYRGKRLLVPGSWLGLGGSRAWTRDEASRLARIAVDLPTDLDNDWQIDVCKSQARPPSSIRRRLTAIGGACREKAREVFAFRGRHSSAERSDRAKTAVWLAQTNANGTRYSINREHPAVTGLVSEAGPSRRLLNALLAVIEQSVPVERIWLDLTVAEGAAPKLLSSEAIEQLSSSLADLADVLPVDLPVSERVDRLLA